MRISPTSETIFDTQVDTKKSLCQCIKICIKKPCR